MHTSELPNGNATSDSEINRVADADDRVVVTKDRDFRDSHLLRGTPRHLLVVTTGNITNDNLLALFSTISTTCSRPSGKPRSWSSEATD